MKIPNKHNIEAAKELKEKMFSWNKLYDLILREFNIYLENKNLSNVRYKIDLVDKLYNCNLKLDKRRVTIEIVNLNIDEKFDKEDTVSVVQKIANIKFPDYGRSVGYVFSSKFCHFHYPSKFPIYDQYARRALSKLCGKNLSHYENNYKQFKMDMDILISKLSWHSSYKKMDEFLWLYGQWLLWKKMDKTSRESNFSKEFHSFITSHKDLFIKLDP